MPESVSFECETIKALDIAVNCFIAIGNSIFRVRGRSPACNEIQVENIMTNETTTIGYDVDVVKLQLL